MENSTLKEFIAKCERITITSDVNALAKLFEKYLSSPKIDERFLHAKLFFHMKENEKNARLLLYDYSLDHLDAPKGKENFSVDFLFLVDGKLILIEAKYLDHSSGHTKRVNRTKKREKIFSQLKKRRIIY